MACLSNLIWRHLNLAALALGATAASRNQTVVKMREWREHKKPKAVPAEFW